MIFVSGSQLSTSFFKEVAESYYGGPPEMMLAQLDTSNDTKKMGNRENALR
jgi:hypothetical protein